MHVGVAKIQTVMKQQCVLPCYQDLPIWKKIARLILTHSYLIKMVNLFDRVNMSLNMRACLAFFSLILGVGSILKTSESITFFVGKKDILTKRSNDCISGKNSHIHFHFAT